MVRGLKFNHFWFPNEAIRANVVRLWNRSKGYMTTYVTSELCGLGGYLRKGRKWWVTEKAVSGYVHCLRLWQKVVGRNPCWSTDHSVTYYPILCSLNNYSISPYTAWTFSKFVLQTTTPKNKNLVNLFSNQCLLAYIETVREQRWIFMCSRHVSKR